MTFNKTIIAAGLGLIFSASAQASTVNYIIDQSNSLADNIPYLSVSISDIADSDDGGFAFTVSTLADLNSLTPGPNFGIKTFAFNSSSLLAGSVEFTGAATNTWSQTGSKNISEFGVFQTVLNANQGNLTVSELTFVVHESGDSMADYTTENLLGNMFAAHVIDFNNASTESGHEHSAWFSGNTEDLTLPAPVVPVPAAAWLFGSGLLGLMGVARRREIA